MLVSWTALGSATPSTFTPASKTVAGALADQERVPSLAFLDQVAELPVILSVAAPQRGRPDPDSGRVAHIEGMAGPTGQEGRFGTSSVVIPDEVGCTLEAPRTTKPVIPHDGAASPLIPVCEIRTVLGLQASRNSDADAAP